MTVNPIELQKHLKGVHYPASKQELLDAARENGGEGEVCRALEALPERPYQRPTDVTEALKNKM